jgi:hypothetical protein|nr:hypothetical protein [Clostridia bacterium]
MKIDKEKLAAIVALPDEELWRMIREVAASHGFKLPENAPAHTEMEKIRNAVSHGASPNITEALRVINDYRRGKK